MRVAAGAWATLGALLLAAPSQGAFSIEILRGLEQNRNFDRRGHWSRQWVRSVPPRNEPHLVVVLGPDAWLSEEGRPTGIAEVVAGNRSAVAALVEAMSAVGLLGGDDPILTAAEIVSVLRPLSVGVEEPMARRSRLWLLWEILADSSHADTLSVALSSLQTLAALGREAELALYPTRSGRRLYGVLVRDHRPGAAAPWAVRVGADALVAVVQSPPPAPALDPAEIEVWSWSEILAGGWSPPPAPSGDPRSGEAGAEAPGGTAAAPDLCTQAVALGFECVTADPRAARQSTLAAISAAIAAILISWLVLAIRAARRRRAKAELRREVLGKNRF